MENPHTCLKIINTMRQGIFCRVIRMGLMVLYILNITTLINDLIESKYRLLDFYQGLTSRKY